MKRFMVCLALLMLAALSSIQAEAKWPASCQQAYESQDPAERVRLYTECIDSGYNGTDAFYGRGKAYKDNHQYKRAIQDYDRAILIDPHDAESYNGRGIAYKNLGQYQKAIQDYGKTIELDPDHKFAFANRGNVYYRHLGQYQRAIEDYERAMEADPSRPSTLLCLAWLFATCPNPAFLDGPRAVELAQGASSMRKTGVGLSILAAALARAGRYSEAVSTQEEALALDQAAGKTSSPLADWKECLALYRQGKPYTEK